MHEEVDEWDLRDLGKDRGMASESWQNQRSLSTSCTVRKGAHIDRKDHVVNASSSALVIHLFHEGLEHGTRRYED